jgi:hypothetical protein
MIETVGGDIVKSERVCEGGCGVSWRTGKPDEDERIGKRDQIDGRFPFLRRIRAATYLELLSLVGRRWV